MIDTPNLEHDLKQAQARIEKLEAENKSLASRLARECAHVVQAAHAAAELREFARQIQAHRDKKLNEIDKENTDLTARIALLEREKNDLRQLVETATARACEWQEKYTALEEKLNQIVQERDQALSLAEQNARIAAETEQARRDLAEENSVLREQLATLQEQFRHDEIANDPRDQRIEHLESLSKTDNRIIQQDQEREAWRRALLKNPHIESAAKCGIIALSEKLAEENQYAPIDMEAFGQAFGVSRQTASRIIHDLEAVGAIITSIREEPAIVPDRRRGERKIVKKKYSVAPTKLLEHPEDLRKPEDKKKQGGSEQRCHNCNSENTIKRVYHTICLECGYEDVYYNEDAQAARDRALGNVVQDEQHTNSDPDAQATHNHAVISVVQVEPQSTEVPEENPPAQHQDHRINVVQLERHTHTHQQTPRKKIGTCLVHDKHTGKPCGSTRWLPDTVDEYVCMKCLSPVGWTKRILEERNALQEVKS